MQELGESTSYAMCVVISIGVTIACLLKRYAVDSSSTPYAVFLNRVDIAYTEDAYFAIIVSHLAMVGNLYIYFQIYSHMWNKRRQVKPEPIQALAQKGSHWKHMNVIGLSTNIIASFILEIALASNQIPYFISRNFLDYYGLLVFLISATFSYILTFTPALVFIISTKELRSVLVSLSRPSFA